jgi:hypothetical protein
LATSTNPPPNVGGYEQRANAQGGREGQQPSEGQQQAQNQSQQGQGQQGESQQNGQGQQGNQPGQPAQSGQNGQSGQAQNGSQQGQAGQRGQPGQQASANPGRRGGQPGGQRAGGGSFLDQVGGEEGGGFAGGPITGAQYGQWSERLRDVEEMLDVPELRAEAARIRDRARNARQDLKRHSKEPQWDLVKMEIARPLVELRTRISEELARRESKEALVPIDRDPVPTRYSELVRRYYEQLGKSEPTTATDAGGPK